MRVFVTGATGALGRHLVPGLVAAGHEVTATTRTPGKVAQLREAGAEPVILDGLDREAVIAAVRAASPEVVVHQMTALADMRSLRNPDKAFAATNELRILGTDNLLAAAARAGTRRVIAQGYAGAGPDKRSGGRLKTEEDPLDWRPIRSAVQGRAAITYVDKTVPLEAPEGIVLRYGTFYGPGASEILLDAIRKRQIPVIGGGTGIWSFIEITDAAAATLAAVGRGLPGVYNVVDSDPAPVAEWLPYLAKVVGAKPPLRVPAWLGRLLAGEFVVAQMTSARGSSNEKARKELGWDPRYATDTTQTREEPMSDLQAIADRVEIEALRGEFTDAAMMRDRARLASLFTHDGALRMPNIPAELVGREEIRAGGERLQGQWDFFVQTTHPGTIQLDGDTATGRAYIQELARARDGRQGLNYAIYHDRYRRTPDGWKFTERVYEVRYLDTSPLAGSAPRVAGAPADPPAGDKAAADGGR